ncbi:MAG: NADH-quinone oxidoreductase subunit C [Actinomycetota bacterium]|nr:NADH-quinone oxidoreductase subunit C [Actinomycetota bacterium]
MTSSPSDTEAAPHPLQDFADSVAETVGGTATIEADTVKVKVAPDSWVNAHLKARDELNLVFFSWLSGVDWANEVEAGDPLSEEVEERFEILSTVGDLSEGRRVTFSTDLSKDSASVGTLIEVFAGANWHEREAAEMFGIDFAGHPDLSPLYLPESFVGNPLRKDYPLLSREVKPWPGTVDVESMPEKSEPSTENPEA